MTRALRAVLFDVDFTLAKPGPLLGPDGYRAAGERHGLSLDPARYTEARAAAVEDLEHHPELEHDEEVWIRFTEDIVRGMGGAGDRARTVAEEITRGWDHCENFELYDDALPAIDALHGLGLAIGLVSNTGRDLHAFVAHHRLDVDAAISSGAHGKTKPHESIFRAVLDKLGVAAHEAAMVGDSVDDDVEGARALGMRGLLVDREGRHPEWDGRLTDLRELPAALGLSTAPSPGSS